MCGAYNVINDPFTASLTEALDVMAVETRGIRVPASMIQIITQDDHDRYLEDAKWWLLLDNKGKPNYQYATFNSRYDKLFSSSLTMNLFKTSRCLIPASSFIEGQNKKYHEITSERGAVALGGIYKQYQIGGETLTTASIITCPGNDKLEHIHRKSTPLMIDVDDESLVEQWLDPNMTNSEAFKPLLTEVLPFNLIATPIQGARDLIQRAARIEITA